MVANAPLVGCTIILSVLKSKLLSGSLSKGVKGIEAIPPMIVDVVAVLITGGLPTGTVTVKSLVLVAVFPATVTVIFPVVAPAGTVVVILVAVLAVTGAVVPLNFTVLLAGVVLKFVPVIITDALTVPEVALNEVMVGNAAAVTVKLAALVAVLPAIVTVIVPVVAPLGTVVVMLVAVLAVTVAVVPLNITVLFAGVVLKFVPVMVTDAPIMPAGGANEIIVGSDTVVTVKLVAEVAVIPATVTAMEPVVAPSGTVTVMLVAALAVTVAATPLNVTVLLDVMALKFVPVIVTVVPIGPEAGVKLLMVGGVIRFS